MAIKDCYNTRKNLQKFAEKYGLSDDWHEPDQKEVTAFVSGKYLDNAMGDSGDCQEMVIMLLVAGKHILSVNLANILALAAEKI